MKKELIHLLFGLLITLSSFIGSDSFFLSWEITLIIGLSLMAYRTYRLVHYPNKKQVFISLSIALGITIIAGVLNLSSNTNQISLEMTDLNPGGNYNNIETCEEGKDLATKEIEKGKLKYIFGSFGSKQELPKNIEENYDIEIIKINGLLSTPNRCYNNIMYKEIQKRYGQDAFSKFNQ